MCRLQLLSSIVFSCTPLKAAGQEVSQQLAALTFLHEGTVGGPSDNLTAVLQCNGFSEDGALWTQWGPRSYLYNNSNGQLQAPAMGLRSAVPLGGLGTGSIELRADGTFADWTIENQGTSLAADATRNSKIPLKNEAFLALWASSPGGAGPMAAALRTAPLVVNGPSTGPAQPFAIPTVGTLTYSGAFPFARHAVSSAFDGSTVASAGHVAGGHAMETGSSGQAGHEEHRPSHSQGAPSFPLSNISLFSYSPFQLWNSSGSGIPAVAFTVLLTNPSPSESINVSVLLSMPLGTSADTDRPLSDTPGQDPYGQTIASLPNSTLESCMAACDLNPACTWYRYQGGNGTPPVPPVTMPNNDCPGNDMYPRYIVSTLEDCTAICPTVPSCGGVVFDTIPGEQQEQCNNTAGSGKYCCLLKTQCTSYSAKDGDTAWAAGIPGQPGQVCTLYRGAPAVEQYAMQAPGPQVQADGAQPDSATSGSRRPYYASSPSTGPRTGIKGYWSSTADGTGLLHTRANTYDSSQNASWQDPAAAVATFAMLSAEAASAMPAAASGSAQTGPSPVSVSTTATTDLASLWADFQADGVLGSGNTNGVVDSSHGATGAPVSPNMAGHGAIAVSTVVQPGETRSLTIVFSWHLPHRLYVGQDLGNQYATVYPDALSVAQDVAGRLQDVVANGAVWNALCTDNSLPPWMQDFMLNSLASQVKMGVWVARDPSGNLMTGGRYRQFEAFSNCDLDPVHVSSYHALPYATFWPDLAANTIITGWAVEQQGDGMIREFLGDFSAPGGRLTGQMDSSAGGRTMADTTSVFILYSYAVFLSTGNSTWLASVYPNLTAAARWHIARAQQGTNGTFPPYLQNTYDYLGLDKHPMQAYTGFLHIGAMKAYQAISTALGQGDGPVVQQAGQSAVEVAQTMQQQLWVGNTVADTTAGSFWRAWQTTAGDGPSIPMSGTLHGQSWAAALGLGQLMDGAQLQSHLDAEVAFNCAYQAPGASTNCSLGLLTLAGAPGESSWSLDASPAQSMDHTAILAWLGGPDVLDGSPAHTVVDLYRSTLQDMWNWHDLHVGPGGLTCGNGPNGQVPLQGTALAGTPFVNAHYARQLQLWAVQRLVVGQHWDASVGSLTFSPAVLRPGLDRLPWFTSQAAGTLELQCDGPQEGQRTADDVDGCHAVVTVVHGRVSLFMLRVEVRGALDGQASCGSTSQQQLAGAKVDGRASAKEDERCGYATSGELRMQAGAGVLQAGAGEALRVWLQASRSGTAVLMSCQWRCWDAQKLLQMLVGLP